MNFQGEKTLVLNKAHTDCCDPYHVHAQAALLVVHVHTHVSLLTGNVPVDRLVYVED
jgi:hypothetical protein